MKKVVLTIALMFGVSTGAQAICLGSASSSCRDNWRVVTSTGNKIEWKNNKSGTVLSGKVTRADGTLCSVYGGSIGWDSTQDNITGNVYHTCGTFSIWSLFTHNTPQLGPDVSGITTNNNMFTGRVLF